MDDSGMGFVSIIFALVVIAILALTLSKNPGKQGSKTTDARVDRAKAVECDIKIKALNKEIEVYKMGNEHFPSSLDEVTDEPVCPVSHVALKYNKERGRAWCPEHTKK
ncbi:MAG: type II secretion system protein [bacterium]